MTQHMVASRPASPDRYRWLQWFAAADPGETLLLNATRATLGVVVSVLAVVALTRLFAGGQQLTTVSADILALVGSMLCAVLVSDATIRDQKITVFSCSSPWPAGRDRHARIPDPLAGRQPTARRHLPRVLRSPFRAEVRRPGTGGSSSFLIALNTHAKVAQMPWLVITAGVVVCFAYLFRFAILPPRPARVLSRSIAAFYIRAAMVLDQLAESSRAWAQPRRNVFPEASSSCISVRG